MKKIKTLISAIAFLFLITSTTNASAPVSTPTTDDPVKTEVINAVKDFKSLPRAERKARIHEARKALEAYRANGKADTSDNNILAIIFAILIPPVGVLIYQNGKITTKFWISLLLTLLFWLPGAIYSLLVVTGNA